MSTGNQAPVKAGLVPTPAELQRDGWSIELRIVVDDNPVPDNEPGLIQTVRATRSGLAPDVVAAYLCAVPKTWVRHLPDGSGPMQEKVERWNDDGIEWAIRNAMVMSYEGCEGQEGVAFGFRMLIACLDRLVAAVGKGVTVEQLLCGQAEVST